MSTWGEEKREGVRAEADRAARQWRSKVAAVADNYQRRIRQLTAWTERLGRERAALEQERVRLSRENESLRTERDELAERICNLRCEAVLGFLGTALEKPIERERLNRVVCDGDRHRRILSMLPDDRNGTATATSRLSQT